MKGFFKTYIINAEKPHKPKMEGTMAIAKIIEVVSEGKTLEEAIQGVVDQASKSIHNIKGVDILNFHAKVENNKVVSYRVDAKVAFVLD
jgi:dodecin